MQRSLMYASLVEAAGIEPDERSNTNLLMARDFGSYALHLGGLADRRLFHSSSLESTRIDPRHGDILETEPGMNPRYHVPAPTSMT
jgi:hypothetical protein